MSVEDSPFFVFSSADTVGPTWTDPDPGWTGSTGAGPAGSDPADHHPAAPDCCHRWPDSGNSASSISAGAKLIWKGQTSEPKIIRIVEMGKKTIKNILGV